MFCQKDDLSRSVWKNAFTLDVSHYSSYNGYPALLASAKAYRTPPTEFSQGLKTTMAAMVATFCFINIWLLLSYVYQQFKIASKASARKDTSSTETRSWKSYFASTLALIQRVMRQRRKISAPTTFNLLISGFAGLMWVIGLTSDWEIASYPLGNRGICRGSGSLSCIVLKYWMIHVLGCTLWVFSTHMALTKLLWLLRVPDNRFRAWKYYAVTIVPHAIFAAIATIVAQTSAASKYPSVFLVHARTSTSAICLESHSWTVARYLASVVRILTISGIVLSVWRYRISFAEIRRQAPYSLLGFFVQMTMLIVDLVILGQQQSPQGVNSDSILMVRCVLLLAVMFIVCAYLWNYCLDVVILDVLFPGDKEKKASSSNGRRSRKSTLKQRQPQMQQAPPTSDGFGERYFSRLNERFGKSNGKSDYKQVLPGKTRDFLQHEGNPFDKSNDETPPSNIGNNWRRRASSIASTIQVRASRILEKSLLKVQECPNAEKILVRRRSSSSANRSLGRRVSETNSEEIRSYYYDRSETGTISREGSLNAKSASIREESESYYYTEETYSEEVDSYYSDDDEEGEYEDDDESATVLDDDNYQYSSSDEETGDSHSLRSSSNRSFSSIYDSYSRRSDNRK